MEARREVTPAGLLSAALAQPHRPARERSVRRLRRFERAASTAFICHESRSVVHLLRHSVDRRAIGGQADWQEVSGKPVMIQ